MRRTLVALAMMAGALLPATAGAAPNNCMPNPASCGFPDMTNTGTLPGVARTAASGVVTLSTAGQVYENRTVTGRINVTAANVTIRNVKVSSNGGWSIRCRTQEGACKNLTIVDTEIQMNGDVDDYGIVGQSYTATRVQVHGGADCAYYESDVTIRDSFCSLGPDANNDGVADSTTFCDPNGPHFDGFSSDGGSNQVYDHNTIRNPCSQTSAILISTNSGTIRNVKITNNLLAGGGYTLYCDAGPDVQGGEVVTGNRIARTYRPQGGYYGPAANCGGSSMTYSGNVWDDTGVLLPGQGSSPPPPPPADRDGDGIPDLSDACPDVAAPGTLDGCPVQPPPPPPPPPACDDACVAAKDAQIADLKAQVTAQTKRADTAEAVAAARLDKLGRIRAILDE